MKRYVFLLFFMGLLCFQGCSNKSHNADNTVDTKDYTQTNIEQETPLNSKTINTDEKVSFRLEHPFLFTIIIVSSLLAAILIVLIITSKISDTITGTIGKSIGEAILGLFKK